MRVDAFVIDSVVRSPQPFQGHTEVRLVGQWISLSRTIPSATNIVRTEQPLGRLAAYLLDPESDDGFATWNAFDTALAPTAAFPVQRASLPPTPR
jgi:hypothetical protein